MFTDRRDGALKLARELEKYSDQDCVLIAIPMGGVIIGVEIANRLQTKLEIVMVKKLFHPVMQKKVIGAVTLDNYKFDLSMISDVSEFYLYKEIAEVRRLLKSKQELFLEYMLASDLTDKTVIIADEGISTGFSILTVIDIVRQQNPKKIVVASPVVAPDCIGFISPIVDEMIYLDSPLHFEEISNSYKNYPQIEDAELIDILRQNR